MVEVVWRRTDPILTSIFNGDVTVTSPLKMEARIGSVRRQTMVEVIKN